MGCVGLPAHREASEAAEPLRHLGLTNCSLLGLHRTEANGSEISSATAQRTRRATRGRRWGKGQARLTPDPASDGGVHKGRHHPVPKLRRDRVPNVLARLRCIPLVAGLVLAGGEGLVVEVCFDLHPCPQTIPLQICHILRRMQPRRQRHRGTYHPRKTG